MIGLGCMRLSTDANRDDARSREVLRTALAEGITLFDTADAYCLDDLDVGHNEKLLAAAIKAASENQVRPELTAGENQVRPELRVEIVTKGGLVRPEGAWVPKGSARHLDTAARASRERLSMRGLPTRGLASSAPRGSSNAGVEQISPIDLYLLHVIDPRVPLATSVRALAKLRDEAVVRAIGLSNVSLHQLEQALEIAPIAAIEIELGPHKLDALFSGLVAACLERGIQVLAHRPLGGPNGVKRLGKDKKLQDYAASVLATPQELALAWLAAKGVVPIPGATRVETVHSIARANRLLLDAELVRSLDDYWLGNNDPVTSASRAEVVLVMGMPGAGKTTIAKSIEAQGYKRLNRDERGGTLAELARELGAALAGGATRVVLDNTYGSRASRALVIRAARKHGARVSCRVLVTSIEQAQHNAVSRMLDDHGRLLEPAEMQQAKAIGPGAQFRYRKSYEPPRMDEGFASVEEVAFETRPTGGTRRALLVELDTMVWRARPTSADGVQLVDGARDQLERWHRAGWLLAGTTWQTSPAADARLRELLGLPIDVLRCPHPAGPPVCWCRKPMPGLALAFARAHDVDLARSVHVGHGPADRGFAVRAGLDYFDLGDGWPDVPDAARARATPA
ncbi:MAG TPA: aldo/keto reductase [Kofleriaceae bacterium]|nr:aldo/keto reductase [Kofleriaceae bacterium]